MTVIKSVELKNFMCHSNIKFEFRKQLSLITGLNGSGKSAVMIAIGLVFGQKAAQLERGRSFGLLVKTDASEAVIRVVLNNSEFKFGYDFFGDEIVVEKVLKVSRPKLDVCLHNRSIVDTQDKGDYKDFSVDDNNNNKSVSDTQLTKDEGPIGLEYVTNKTEISQDGALDERMTGNNTNESQGILLTSQISFKKSQQIKFSSQIKITTSSGRVWSRSNSDLEKIKTSLMLHLDNPINFLTQDYSKKFLSTSDPKILYDLFLKASELKFIKGLHDNANKLAKEMQSKINDIIKEIKGLKQQINEKEELLGSAVEIKNLEKQVNYLKLSGRWSTINFDTFIDYKKRIDDANNQIESLSQDKLKYEALTEVFESRFLEITESSRYLNVESRKQISELQNKISADNIQKRELMNDINDIQNSIGEVTKKLNSVERLKEKDNTEKLRNDISQLQETIKSEKAEFSEMEKSIEAVYSKFAKRQAEIDSTKRKIQEINSKIVDQKKIQKNRNIFFGNRMPNLINMVENARFRNVVIGPIYKEISLLEHKWYKPISIILNKVLPAFICFDNSDRSTLQDLMKKAGVSFPIYVPTNKSRDILPFKENTKYKTALRVLKIRNNIVLNQLIILTGLESIILVEDRLNAYDILETNPQDVDMAFTIQGDIIKKYKDSMSDLAQSKRIDYYFENDSDKMQSLYSEYEKIKQTDLTNNYENEYQALRKNYSILDRSITSKSRQLDSLTTELEALERLKNQYFNEDENFIKQELETNKAQLSDLKNLLKELDQGIDQHNHQIRTLKNQCQCKDQEVRDAQDKKIDNQSKIANIRRELMEIDNKIKRYTKSLETIQGEIFTEVQKIKKSYDLYYRKYPEDKKEGQNADNELREGHTDDFKNKPEPNILLDNHEEIQKFRNSDSIGHKNTQEITLTSRSDSENQKYPGSQTSSINPIEVCENLSKNKNSNQHKVQKKEELRIVNSTDIAVKTNIWVHNDQNRTLEYRNNFVQSVNPYSIYLKNDDSDVAVLIDHKINLLREIFDCTYIPSNIIPLHIIKREINHIERKIEARRHNITPFQLKKEIKSLQSEKEQREKTILEYENQIKMIHESALLRNKKREEIKIHESKRATLEFKKLMLNRNYHGKLIFDHQNETLNIKVKIIGNNLGGDKNTLSGGERSFAGICFLLSLWPSTSCYLKILDEFDVFMDSLNRKIAMELIVNHLKTHKKVKQVLLISPLDSSFQTSDICEIIVLQPPKRLS